MMHFAGVSFLFCLAVFLYCFGTFLYFFWLFFTLSPRRGFPQGQLSCRLARSSFLRQDGWGLSLGEKGAELGVFLCIIQGVKPRLLDTLSLLSLGCFLFSSLFLFLFLHHHHLVERERGRERQRESIVGSRIEKNGTGHNEAVTNDLFFSVPRAFTQLGCSACDRPTDATLSDDPWRRDPSG